jgi:hypothetical protein
MNEAVTMTRAPLTSVVTLLLAGLALSGCGSGIVGTPASQAVPLAVSSGPQLGYVWDPAVSSIRPILGVPGASQFGQPVTGPGMYMNGAASVRASLGLLQAADGSIDSITLPSGSSIPIAGATAAAGAAIVFSPSGQNAILFVPGGSSIVLLTALGTTPQVKQLNAPASLLAAAVGDTGQVAVVSGGGPLAVTMLTGSGAPLLSLSGFGGFAFLPNADSLVAADSSTGMVTLLRNASTAPSAQAFTSTSIRSPLAIAASRDGNYAVVANSADPSVVRIDLSGATAPLRIGCACQPAQLTTFAGNAVFSLSAPGSATPAWVVDASAATPRTVFIPAVKP